MSEGGYADSDIPERELTALPERTGKRGRGHGRCGRESEDVSGGVEFEIVFIKSYLLLQRQGFYA